MRNDNTIVIENKNVNFLMTIDERNGLWDASGTVPNFFVRPVKNFQEIYNNKLTPEIVAFSSATPRWSKTASSTTMSAKT